MTVVHTLVCLCTVCVDAIISLQCACYFFENRCHMGDEGRHSSDPDAN